MTFLRLTKSIGWSPSRLALLLILLVFACLAIRQSVQAVLPPPDGGYPGLNTAEGQSALFSLTTGSANTAVGWFSLKSDAEGSFNTAIGTGALLFNTADQNTATGAAALLSNTTGVENTATGAASLASNSIGSYNTASGNFALNTNRQGSQNTAFGDRALLSNTTGFYNIALGYSAGANLTTGNYNIDLGNPGNAGESDTIRIGDTGSQTATYIAGIAGQTVGAGGSTCYVDNDGKLGVFLSARRFKTDIADMGDASEALLALRPVTFHYRPELDKTCIPQFGLVAEEVAKVNPDLVARDADGKVYTVRYEAVNAMLLNEFLKEHHTVQELKSTMAKQEATIVQQKKDFQAIVSQQQKQIEALTAGLQKVSAQLELNKPVPQVVNNNQ